MPTISRFITPLHVEQVDERDWRVMDDFIYDSTRLDRRVTVYQGFVTDFASVPRLPFVYFLTGGLAVRAAVVHDACYRGAVLTTRAEADSVFREIMKLTGHWYWRRWLMYFGLRLFGWWAWRANHARSGMGNAKARGAEIVNDASDSTPKEKEAAQEKAAAIIEAVPIPAVASLASAKNPNAKHGQVELSMPPMPDSAVPEKKQ